VPLAAFVAAKAEPTTKTNIMDNTATANSFFIKPSLIKILIR
jgi:hypothetical protein